MPIKAEDWNVQVVGFWNRAIYTPSGIAHQLFRLAATTPVQVFIPIDLPAPYQVRHDDLNVIVASDRTIVQPIRPDYASIVSAMGIACRALDDLPHTPFSAAGINLRFQSGEPVAALDEITASAWDNRLSDAQLIIQERAMSRTIRRDGGRINVNVTQKEDLRSTLVLNFDLQSDDAEKLKAWLAISADELQREAERILYNTMGVERNKVIYG